MNKRQQYAIGQHDLCCEFLIIGKNHLDSGKTLFEEVVSLKDRLQKATDELDEWHDAAKHVDADYADEVHCSCVPILRKQLQDARKEIETLKHSSIMATSTAENSSVVGGLHKSRCENCKRDIDLATNAGHAQGCNYTWGRRGWRQLGEYDG